MTIISPLLKAHSVSDYITGTQEKCLYCKDGYTTHFICPECEAGMCSACYDGNTEHSEQLELLDGEEEKAVQFVELYEAGWLCFSHLGE